MAPMEWESTAVRAHIRFTSQRLGQLQAKLDADASITRKDIATLLQQGNVCLARAKAQKLIQEDALGDLMEVIEMEIGVLLEHFAELDLILSPSPVIAEALSSIIYTASHIHCKELFVLRTLLVQRFGPDFAQSAMQNRDQHVSRRIIQILSAPVPTASMLNGYLVSIARTYSVNWTPDPQRYDVVNILSEILNPEASRDIDIALLRKYCSYGIPDEPSWLRPRIWKLFLGLLPAKQADWEKEITKQRESYYDLVRRLLERYTDLDEPCNPPNVHDASLLNVVHHLSRIPKEMFSPLEIAPEELTACPLSATAGKDVKIPHAFILDERLDDLKEEHRPSGSSETGEDAAPAISISNYDADDSENSQSEATITRAYSFGDAHPIHCSALLRLLFIHANINPGQLSPHIPALLIPIYTALQSEVEPEELAHVEADTFWLFEAIVAEFSELDEKEGSEKWMAELDQTLAWADPELHENLLAKGLQPSLPHYSYRWLATVLTYTIPVPSIFLIWDALFSRLPRERESNPKLEFLVDLATSMLLAVRKELSSLHHSSNTGSRLWADEEAEREVVGNVAPGGDPFLEGISLLQAYPCTSIEDAERIIQTANDLVNRREVEARRNQPLPNPGQQGFGARLRNTMWKGFTNQVTHPDESSNESDREQHRDDGNETEKPTLAPAAPSWWENIAAPRVLTSTQTLRPPAPAGRGEDESGYSSSATKTSTATIWNYAEKLRDSDTVAALAKAGTNWRAKAISAVGPWSPDKPNNNGQSISILNNVDGGSDHRTSIGDRSDTGMKPQLHGSPAVASPSHSPTSPHRSAYSSSSSVSLSPLSAGSQSGDESFIKITKSLLSLKKSTPTKPAPRPLLLSSTSPITSPPIHREPTPDSSQWAEVMKAKKQYLNRDSRSSVSSLSPSDAIRSSRSDWESDSGSRRVPLNRRSISPMAPISRIRGLASPGLNSAGEPFSPSTLSMVSTHSTELRTPSTAPFYATTFTPNSAPGGAATNKVLRVDTIRRSSVPILGGDTSDTGSPGGLLHRNSRVRSRRQTRPAHLQLKDSTTKTRASVETKSPRSLTGTNLTVDWLAEEAELATTPRATTFTEVSDLDDRTPQKPPLSPRLRRRKLSTEPRDRINVRKTSSDGQEGPMRKLSSGNRTRKVSSESKEPRRHHYRRESAAEEGDDEGYDDLLSAYESEDLGSKGLS